MVRQDMVGLDRTGQDRAGQRWVWYGIIWQSMVGQTRYGSPPYLAFFTVFLPNPAHPTLPCPNQPSQAMSAMYHLLNMYSFMSNCSCRRWHNYAQLGIMSTSIESSNVTLIAAEKTMFLLRVLINQRSFHLRSTGRFPCFVCNCNIVFNEG